MITQDVGLRGGRQILLKATVDAAEGEHGVRHVVVFKRTDEPVGWDADRDVWWHDAVAAESADCPPVVCAAEDPLFILYTSGSTGRPKGLMHTCGGYITYAAYTHRTVFDLRPDDVYACVADVGWITGHSYIVYGPLANGATSLMFESTPLYPDAGRYGTWSSGTRSPSSTPRPRPSARAAYGDELVKRYDRSSVRVLGTPASRSTRRRGSGTARWGENRCNIVDTVADGDGRLHLADRAGDADEAWSIARHPASRTGRPRTARPGRGLPRLRTRPARRGPSGRPRPLRRDLLQRLPRSTSRVTAAAATPTATTGSPAASTTC